MPSKMQLSIPRKEGSALARRLTSGYITSSSLIVWNMQMRRRNLQPGGGTKDQARL
jgi:hypothetical protein